MEEALSACAVPAARTTVKAVIKGAAVAAALAALFGLAAPAAHALPVNAKCRVTTYYSDASMTKQVGSYSTCPGSRGLVGRRTAFFEVDEVELGNGPRVKPPGSSTFPCEFQENCVTNLPTPTVVDPWSSRKR